VSFGATAPGKDSRLPQQLSNRAGVKTGDARIRYAVLHSTGQINASLAGRNRIVKPKAVIYIVAAILVGVLMVANWTLLSTSIELQLLIARIQAPLGVVILLVAGLILLVDLAVHALTQHAWMRERRALTKDLEGARSRAEREEESRSGALRATLERELATIRAQLDQLTAGQSALLGRLPTAQRGEVLPQERVRVREASQTES
jgi:uncharacterized integral membrane protein